LNRRPVSKVRKRVYDFSLVDDPYLEMLNVLPQQPGA